MNGSPVASAGLLGLAGMHLGWAAGGSFPFASRAALAERGAGMSVVPHAPACVAVAIGLSAATALVSGRPRHAPAVSRAGSAGVAAVLAARGTLGLAGRTSAGATAGCTRRCASRSRRSPLRRRAASALLCAAQALRRL